VRQRPQSIIGTPHIGLETSVQVIWGPLRDLFSRLIPVDVGTLQNCNRGLPHMAGGIGAVRIIRPGASGPITVAIASTTSFTSAVTRRSDRRNGHAEPPAAGRRFHSNAVPLYRVLYLCLLIERPN
jgi:hypothetical protein